MEFKCSLLVVNDIAESRKFYEEILEMTVAWDHGENVFFKGGFAIHDRKHFGTLIEKEIGGGNLSKNTVELYFETDALEDFAAKLEVEGVELVHPIKAQPWGQPVIRFRDPSGHIIEVGESLEYGIKKLAKEGKSPEEISKICSMPLEFVNKVLSEE